MAKRLPTVQSWYADPEWQKLPFDAKRTTLSNYFDKELADQEFWKLPRGEQDKVKRNFIAQQFGLEDEPRNGDGFGVRADAPDRQQIAETLPPGQPPTPMQGQAPGQPEGAMPQPGEEEQPPQMRDMIGQFVQDSVQSDPFLASVNDMVDEGLAVAESTMTSPQIAAESAAEPDEPPKEQSASAALRFGPVYDLQENERRQIAELQEKDYSSERGFIDVIKETEPQELVPFLAGAFETADMLRLYNATQRLQDGEATESDIIRLNDFVQKTNQKTTTGGKVADVLTMLPAFMGEFITTSGLYSAGRAATTKGVSKGLKWLVSKTGKEAIEKQMKNIARDKGAAALATKVAGGIVGATMQTPAAMSTRIPARALKEMMPDMQLSSEQADELHPVIVGQGDDAWSATKTALGDAWVEVVSEHSGGLLLAAAPGVRNLAAKVGLARAWKKANPTKGWSQFRDVIKRAGWNGYVGEIFEERVGEVGRAAIGIEEYKAPSPEQLAVEMIAFAVPGVVFGAAQYAGDRKIKRQEAEQAARQLKEDIRRTAESFGGREVDEGEIDESGMAAIRSARAIQEAQDEIEESITPENLMGAGPEEAERATEPAAEDAAVPEDLNEEIDAALSTLPEDETDAVQPADEAEVAQPPTGVPEEEIDQQQPPVDATVASELDDAAADMDITGEVDAVAEPVPEETTEPSALGFEQARAEQEQAPPTATEAKLLGIMEDEAVAQELSEQEPIMDLDIDDITTINADVERLGSPAAVAERYDTDSPQDRYARQRAERIYGEQAEIAPKMGTNVPETGTTAPEPETILAKSGRPYKTQAAATRRANEMGPGYEVVETEGGFGVRQEQPAAQEPRMEDTGATVEAEPTAAETAVPAEAEPAAAEPTAEPEGEVLLASSGRPFATKKAAQTYAKRKGEGYDVIPYGDRWAVRRKPPETTPARELTEEERRRVEQELDEYEGMRGGYQVERRPESQGFTVEGPEGEAVQFRSKKSPQGEWYSQLESVIERKLPERGTVPGFKKTIQAWAKKGEFKQDELEWSGLLNDPTSPLSKDVGKVEKQEVIDWLAANNVRVEEVRRGARELQLERRGDRWYDPAGSGITIEKMPNGIYVLKTPGGVRENFQSMGEAIATAKETYQNTAAADDTEFSQWQLPGGENYREVLLTLPVKEEQPTYVVEQRPNGRWAIKAEGQDGWISSRETQEEAERDAARMNELGLTQTTGTAFTTGHFDEPNVIAHLRLNDRTDADGNKVLFVEEVQSDWGQKGRDEGFKAEYTKEDVELQEEDSRQWVFQIKGEPRHFIGVGKDEAATREEALEQVALPAMNRNWSKGAIPRAPFVERTDRWAMLAMKKAIRMAAEGGYDKIAWTTGEQQAARYDLSKQVDAINVARKPTGDYTIAIVRDGAETEYLDTKRNKLSETVGKDLAQRIESDFEADASPKSYRGLDLKVGGEGMKAFYDKILPNMVNKYVKKWGGRVGRARIKTGIPEGPLTADEYAAMGDGRVAVHSLSITPKMRQSVLMGQPLFRPASTREGAPIQSMGVLNVERSVQSLRDRVNIPVRVVGSVEDLVGDIRTAAENEMRRGNVVTGYYDPIAHEIVVLADNIQSEAELLRAVMPHELAHYGIKGALGEKDYNAFLKDLQNDEVIGPQIKQLMKDYNWKGDYAASEWFAMQAEGRAIDEVNPSLWQRILNYIKKWFRKRYGDGIETYTNTDIDLLLQEAFDYATNPQVRENTPASDPMYRVAGMRDLLQQLREVNQALEDLPPVRNGLPTDNIRNRLEAKAEELEGQIQDRDLSFRARKMDDTRLQKKLRAREAQLPEDGKGEIVKKRMNTLIREEIKALQRGHKLGTLDARQTLRELKSFIINYAGKYLPEQGITRGQARPLLNAVAQAETAEEVMAAYDRVDKITRTVTEKQLRRDIYKLLKRYKPSRKDSQIRGKVLTPDDYRDLEDIRKIVKMDESDIIAVMRDIGEVKRERAEKKEGEEAPQDIEEFAPEVQEMLDKLDVFGNLKNKSVSELQQAKAELESLIETGRMRKREQEEARKQEMREFKDRAVKIIAAGRGILSEEEVQAQAFERGKPQREGALTKLYQENVSFEYLLYDLTRNQKDVRFLRGLLNDRFMPMVQTATNAESRGVREWMNALQDKLGEIYGTTDSKRLLKIATENTTPHDLGIKIKQGDKEVPLILSQDQAAKKWMEWQDPTLDGKFEEMGYTPEVMDAIERFLKPETRAWAEYQLYEFYPQYYDPVNQVFRRRYGVDLPYNPFYSPISVRYEGQRAEEDQMLADSGPMFSSILNSHLKLRTKNKRALRLIGADSALIRHIVQMEHFKAWAEPMRDLRSFFGDESIRTAIKQNFGPHMMRKIDDYLNDFARGGIDPRVVEKAIDALRANFTATALGFNLSLIPKQIVSFPAYAATIPTTSYVSGLIDFTQNFRTAIRTLKESELLKARYGVGWDRDVILAMRGSEQEQLTGGRRRTQKLRDAAMFATKLGDKTAIMAGWTVYRHHYNAALKEGKSPDEAKQIAMYEFEAATARSQQSGQIQDLPSLMRKGSWVKPLTMFMTAQNGYFRFETTAALNLMRGRGSTAENLKILGIFHFLLPMLFQFIADGLRWQDDRQLRAAILGSLNGLLIVGGWLEAGAGEAIGRLMGVKQYFFGVGGTPILDNLNNAHRAMSTVAGMMGPDGEINWSDATKSLDYSVKFLAHAKGYPVVAPMRIGKSIYQDIRTQEFHPLKWIGYTDYTLRENNPKRQLLDAMEDYYEAPPDERSEQELKQLYSEIEEYNQKAHLADRPLIKDNEVRAARRTPRQEAARILNMSNSRVLSDNLRQRFRRKITLALEHGELPRHLFETWMRKFEKNQALQEKIKKGYYEQGEEVPSGGSAAPRPDKPPKPLKPITPQRTPF